MCAAVGHSSLLGLCFIFKEQPSEHFPDVDINMLLCSTSSTHNWGDRLCSCPVQPIVCTARRPWPHHLVSLKRNDTLKSSLKDHHTTFRFSALRTHSFNEHSTAYLHSHTASTAHSCTFHRFSCAPSVCHLGCHHLLPHHHTFPPVSSLGERLLKAGDYQVSCTIV